MGVIIVTGPQRCGKTRNAEKLCEMLNCSTYLDNGDISFDITEARRLSSEKFMKYDIRNPHFEKDILVLTNQEVVMSETECRIKAVYSYYSLEGSL